MSTKASSMSAGSVLRTRFRLHALLLTALVAGLVAGPVVPALAAPATFVVTRLDDPAPNGCNSGVDCSLREAVTAANTNGNPGELDVIQLPSGWITLSIPGQLEDVNATGDLDVSETVRIVGQGRTGANVTTIDADYIDRVFDVLGVSVVFEDLRILKGQTTAGGGIRTDSPVTLRNVELRGNSATGAGMGGGAISTTSDLVLIDTVATANSAPSGYGGALHLETGGLNNRLVELQNVDIAGNTANEGAGITAWDTGDGLISLVATNSTFITNYAATSGAGVYGYFHNLSLSGVEISDNVAPAGAAGILFLGEDPASATMSLTDVTLARNNGGNAGSGVAAAYAHRVTANGVTIDADGMDVGWHSLFMNEVATGTLTDVSVTGSRGPGAQFLNSALDLQRVTLTQNSTTGSGGGIRAFGSDVSGTDVTIMDNTATAGGGIAVVGSTMRFAGLRLLDNLATGGVFTTDHAGGGVTVFDGGALHLEDSVISGNEADFGGAANVDESSTVTTTNTEIVDNTGLAAGGGLHLGTAAEASSAFTTFTGNTSPEGGAIHTADLSGTMRLGSSIVAGNDVTQCTGTGTFTSVGDNLEDTDSCGLGESSDLVDTDAMLRTVATGEGYALHPPMPESPAVDAFSGGMCGDPAFVLPGPHEVAGDHDLGGTARPTTAGSGVGASSGCDIGAHEVVPDTVLIAAGKDGVEGSTDATFVLTRTGELGGDVTVPLSYSGTATAGDHAAPASVVLPDGAASVTVTVPVLDDDEDESTETLTATIGTLRALGAGGAATVDLLDATEAGGVHRLSGDNRYETAVANALARFDPADVDTVFLATGTNFPDALAGAPLAIDRGAPILLVTPTSLPEVTAGALGTLDPDVVIALGGTAAVGDEVLAAAATAAGAGTTTDRIFGANRYETAAAIARAMPASDTAFLSTGGNFPAALAAGSATEGAPILLTPSSALASATSDVLGELGPASVVALGGTAVVAEDVLSAAGTAAGDAATFRAAGSNRYATGVEIAERLPTPDTVYVAVGTNFPDALAGGPSAFGEGAPIVLVTKETIPTVVRDWLDALPGLRRVVILGGEGAVSAAVAADLATLID